MTRSLVIAGLAAGLVAGLCGGACGRTEPTLDCPNPGRRTIAVESFEDETAPVAYTGFAARELRRDAIGGAYVVGIDHDDGSLRTLTPVLVEGDALLVGYYLLNWSTAGQLEVACSEDGGASFARSESPPPSLELFRDEWIYVEARCPLSGPGREVTVELALSQLVQYDTGRAAVLIDQLTLIEPHSCADDVSPTCVAGARRVVYTNDFEYSEPVVAVTGDWELTNSSHYGHSGVRFFELWQGAGDLRFIEPATPQRGTLLVSLWLRHQQTQTLTLRLAVSTDGGVSVAGTVPLNASLTVDRDEWTNVETAVPVTPGVAVVLALQAVGDYGSAVTPVRIDDVSFVEAGPGP